MPTNLDIVRAAVHKAVPEVLGHDINLEDIIVTIIARFGEKYGGIGRVFNDIIDDYTKGICHRWHFRRSLEVQSEECLAFLASILK